jgi:DNA polymerase-1
MNHLILVDGNNLGFAAMANPKLSAGEKNTHATFVVIKTIRKLFLDNPDALIMILWDGRSWRHEVGEEFGVEYKANREKTEKQVEDRKAYYEQHQRLLEGLHLLGVIQCSASNMEADDLAEIYSRQWTGDKITLLSGDKDWLQLVDERTTWVDPIRDRQCNTTNFRAFTGCNSTEQFVELKSILGDAGDNVKGLMGVGPKTMEKLYCGWNSILDFLNDEDKQIHWKERVGGNIPSCLDLNIDDVISVLTVNESLMSLRTISRPEPKHMLRYGGKLHEEDFKTFCYENSFLSFLKDYDKFLRPFKENKFVGTR